MNVRFKKLFTLATSEHECLNPVQNLWVGSVFCLSEVQNDIKMGCFRRYVWTFEKKKFSTVILHLSFTCITYSLMLTNSLVIFESVAGYCIEIGALRPVQQQKEQVDTIVIIFAFQHPI